jgi:DNA polymerase-1
VRQIILASRRHPGPIGLDIETTPLPQYRREREPVRLNKDGSLAKHQPKHDDPAGLSPHTASIATLQLYAGETHSHIWRSKGGDRPCTPTGKEWTHDDEIYVEVMGPEGTRRTSVPKKELFPAARRGPCFVFRGEALELLIASHWLRSQHLVAHNATFDVAFLRHYAGSKPLAPRRRRGRIECSMQATGLLHGIGNRSLADAGGAFLGLEVSKDVRPSDWGAARLSRGQIAYAALDAVLAYRLWPLLDEQMTAKRRKGAYELQRGAVLPVVDMELRGAMLDRNAHAAMVNKWSRELAEARHRYHELTGKPPPSKPNEVREWLTSVLDANQLAKWPRTESGELSVAAKHLERLGHIPTARPVLEIRAHEKLLQNFGAGLAALINPATGRLHAHYNIAGAKSGRFTCSSPNLQQLPSRRAPDFRRCVIAGPGCLLVGCDWNQIELRAAAWRSGDPKLTTLYAEGRDLHREMAADFAGVAIEAVTKDQRQAAKPVAFGSIYGIGPRALAESAFTNYGVEMTETAAKQALDKFFQRFARLDFWRRNHADDCRARGFVKIGAGRVVEAAWEPGGQISFPRACNLPIQGICADAMLRALTLVHHRFIAAGIRGGLIASVHDELLAEVAEDDAEKARLLLQEAMIEAFVMTFPGAPTQNVAKAVIGRTWFDVKQDEPSAPATARADENADVASAPVDVLRAPAPPISAPSQPAQTAPLAFTSPQPSPTPGRYKILGGAGIGAHCERCGGRIGVAQIQIDGHEKPRRLHAKCAEAFIAEDAAMTAPAVSAKQSTVKPMP